MGAEFLQEWAVRGKVGQWYLGPTLNNPALLRNVPAGVLEGLRGISPDLGANAADFDTYFAEATGVPPLPGSHYYFDAVALLALAIAEGFGQTGAIPEPVTFKLHLPERHQRLRPRSSRTETFGSGWLSSRPDRRSSTAGPRATTC